MANPKKPSVVKKAKPSHSAERSEQMERERILRMSIEERVREALGLAKTFAGIQASPKEQ
jgi:hypothetical protein